MLSSFNIKRQTVYFLSIYVIISESFFYTVKPPCIVKALIIFLFFIFYFVKFLSIFYAFITYQWQFVIFFPKTLSSYVILFHTHHVASRLASSVWLEMSYDRWRFHCIIKSKEISVCNLRA